MKKLVKQALLMVLSVAVLMTTAVTDATSRETVKIAYTSWSSSIAGAHVMQALLQEELGYRVELILSDADDMWQLVADGTADAMLSAWLPTTHEHYLQTYRDRLEDLGPNLVGARIGLVVPDIASGRQVGAQGKRARSPITIESISDLPHNADVFHRNIVGIDPEAGIMARTREAMASYGLDDFRLIEGSEQTMTELLAQAIRYKRQVVVTGWTPHWMFARWNLKFLDDPKGVYGTTEQIHTMVRPGLHDDMPAVYAILDRFSWTPEEASLFMIWNENDHGLYPYEKARRWLRNHPDRVRQWLADGE
jgi:glycine betaine/proline transport system substrate-binding protein